MRVEKPRRRIANGRARVSADVVWEDAGRPPQTLFYEVPERFADDLVVGTDALVLATLPVAVWDGERRLRIDGALCPRLASGLQQMMATWSGWYAHCRPVRLEIAEEAAVPPVREARTAAFFSGGLDSYALLRANLGETSPDQPQRIRDLIVLFGSNGFEFEQGRPQPARLAAFEALLARIAPLAESEGLTVVPVHFNGRWLLPSYDAWASLAYAAMISSAAHALARRHTRALLASSSGGLSDMRHGSHPDLDPLYSSAAVAIEVGDPGVTRFEKTRRILGWEPAARHVQPCWQRSRRLADGRLNCGRCEKCLRTMLALVALGALSEVPAFVEDDVDPRWVERMRVYHPLKLALLEQLKEPLARAGRRDLVRAIERRARRFRRQEFVRGARGWLRRPAHRQAASL